MPQPALAWRPLVAAVVVHLAMVFPALAADLAVGLGADVTAHRPAFSQSHAEQQRRRAHLRDARQRKDEVAARARPRASWKTIDPTTWEFKLRKGVKFHDGSDFTADDVVFTRAPARDRGQPVGFAVYVRRIISKQIVDPYTIRLKTATPYGDAAGPQRDHDRVEESCVQCNARGFRQRQSDDRHRPLQVRALDARRPRRARPLRRILGHARPAWDKVTFRMMSNDPARTAALLSGDVDVIENVPPSDLVRMRANPNVRLEQTVSWRTIFFHMDQSRRSRRWSRTSKASRSARIRSWTCACAGRFRRRSTARRWWSARWRTSRSPPPTVSPQIFGHNAGAKVEGYDPEGAKKLLAEAGYPNGFGITVSAPNDRYVNDDQVAQAVAQMLSRIGIKCAVEAMPSAVFFSRANKLEFSLMLSVGAPTPSKPLPRSRRCSRPSNTEKGMGTSNRGRYSNSKLDAVLDQALATVDDARREKLLQQATEIGSATWESFRSHQLNLWATRRGVVYKARTDENTLATQVPARRSEVIGLPRKDAHERAPAARCRS